MLRMKNTQQQIRNPIKCLAQMKLLSHVKLFMSNLLSCSSKRVYKQLREEHFERIKDKSHFNVESRFLNWSQIVSWTSFYLKKIKVFQPDNSLMMLWNICVFFVTCFEIYAFPLKITFGWSFSEDARLQWCYIVPLLCFLSSILIELNTAYYDNGVIINNKRQILHNYCHNQLRYDIIANLALILGEALRAPSIFSFELLRLYHVTALINKISDYFHLVERFPSLTTLFKLSFLVITTAHFFSCGFQLIGLKLMEKGSITWLQVERLDNASWIEQIINSLYFTFITMLTVRRRATPRHASCVLASASFSASGPA